MCIGVSRWITGCPPLPMVKLIPSVDVATPICPGGVAIGIVSAPVKASHTPVEVKNGAGPCTAPEYQVLGDAVHTGPLVGMKWMPSLDVARPIPPSIRDEYAM